MNVPWLPYLATKFIEDQIIPRWRVFEWGSGGSTRWFARRCQTVVSVEHNPEHLLKDLPQNVTTLFRPPQVGEIGSDIANPTHYKSGSAEYGAVNWRLYAQAIDEYGMFDLVLVDGRARTSCITHAIPHVRKWLVVDNTGDRPYYLQNHHFGDEWEKIVFYGYGPILEYPWETTIFKRRQHE